MIFETDMCLFNIGKNSIMMIINLKSTENIQIKSDNRLLLLLVLTYTLCN